MWRQRCKLCDRADYFDFHVSDAKWREIAGDFVNSVLCLSCFDYIASSKGILYADELGGELWFAGDAAALTLTVTERSQPRMRRPCG